jgi:hypothetical protein
MVDVTYAIGSDCKHNTDAKGNLFNPAIFLPPSHPHMHPPSTLLARRYLDIVGSLKTPTGNSAIKSHIFRVLKPILDAQPDEAFRAKIGKARTVAEYRAVVEELEGLVKVGLPQYVVVTAMHAEVLPYQVVEVRRGQAAL